MMDAELPSAGCIYALADPGCPGLLKIGKDKEWPKRLKQAQSHTPRGLEEVGRWAIAGDGNNLKRAEREALRLFPREKSARIREWVRTDAVEGVAQIDTVLGVRLPATPLSGLSAYDDWRDYAKPPHSRVPRHIWLGLENTTGRIKLVHRPYKEDQIKIWKVAQTYSRHGIQWCQAWRVPPGKWTQSNTLHPADRHLINLWESIVETLGYGALDLRLGWLREGAEAADVRRLLEQGGLVQDTGVLA